MTAMRRDKMKVAVNDELNKMSVESMHGDDGDQ